MESHMTNGFVLLTKTGHLYKQHPSQSDGPSIFATRANAEATNAGTLNGSGSVIELAAGPFEGVRRIDGYWVKAG